MNAATLASAAPEGRALATAAASAPASLLLLGEFAILEEGGLGLALGAEPRVHGRLSPAADFSIGSRLGGTTLTWRAADPTRAPLLACCVAAARDRLNARASAAGREAPQLPPVRIEVDARDFFAADGSKLGLGSSAATAVVLCALLLRAGGIEGEELEDALFATALAAHRAAQGGRGSGYDVAASRWGGLGLFVGGALPRWIPQDAESLPAFTLERGSAPVSTPAAIERYRAWKEGNPSAASGFLAASNARIEAFAAARDARTRLGLIGEAARAGAELGALIGVPAAPPPQGGAPARGGRLVKALGAGDELFGSFFAGPADLPPGGLAPSLAEGFRWE